MTRDEAIEVLKLNYPSACFTDLCEAVDMAIEALEHKRDALRRKIEMMYREPDTQENLHYNLAIAEVLEVIDEFPVADVVEVVRCKECIHMGTDKCPSRLNDADFYCCQGERREDEQIH